MRKKERLIGGGPPTCENNLSGKGFIKKDCAPVWKEKSRAYTGWRKKGTELLESTRIHRGLAARKRDKECQLWTKLGKGED